MCLVSLADYWGAVSRSGCTCCDRLNLWRLTVEWMRWYLLGTSTQWQIDGVGWGWMGSRGVSIKCSLTASKCGGFHHTPLSQWLAISMVLLDECSNTRYWHMEGQRYTPLTSPWHNQQIKCYALNSFCRGSATTNHHVEQHQRGG